MAFNIDGLILAPLMGIFGEEIPATYAPAGGGAAFDIVGVYDAAYRDIEAVSGSTGASDTAPVLGVRLAEFPTGVAPQVNDLVTVASVGVQYVVREIHPDGHGWAKLLLNEVA